MTPTDAIDHNNPQHTGRDFAPVPTTVKIFLIIRDGFNGFEIPK